MTAATKLFGVGARKAVVFVLDPTTGLPVNNGSSGTLDAGTQIEGLKTFTPTDPEPQKFTHYGDDHPEAQDSLPATEAMSAVVTTDKTNMALDAVLAGTTIKNYTISQFLAVNTNKDGDEKQVAFFTYRQALDGNPANSTTFGKRRQWESRILPSTRIVAIENAFEQGITDMQYALIPTIVKQTPWGEDIDTTDFGALQAQMLKGTHEYQPSWAYGYGNNTLTSFILPAIPASTLHVNCWVSGTLVTPGTINTTDGTMTLQTADKPAVDALIFVEVQGTAR